MPNIHVLSQDTINKIAAGEVIERPMAVVKELMENAIDAGSNAITVEIKDGGKSLIRITDNGSGIGNEDVRLAFTPHATSKIYSSEDLLSVSTLGFRGEALASIASVSQLEMITKTREELTGIRYLIDGGEEKTMESIGCPEGTTFLVRNLFYNTPARLKFLKTSPTEAGYINSLMERLALSHPDIAFRFINQNQPKLHTSGNGNLKDVIYHIYGRDITSQLIEVNADEVHCQVKGFLGKPVISRGNRNFMNYFINGRYIKSSVIHKAIEDAYQPYNMQHRYPFTVLHFTIDSKLIDINVHPQKMEIRFTDAKGIYQSVYHAVSEALKYKEFIPEVTLSSKSSSSEIKKVEAGKKNSSVSPVRGPEPFEKKRTDSMKEKRISPIHEKGTASIQVLEEIKRLDKEPQEKGQKAPEISRSLYPEQVQENIKYQSNNMANESKSLEQQVSDDIPANSNDIASLNQEVEIKKDTVSAEKTEIKTEEITQTEEERSTSVPSQHQQAVSVAKDLQKPSQENLFDEGILSEKAQKSIQIIGQVFQTYWILQYEDAMYLVDQHAAHEKVLYERFMKQLQEKEPMVQLLQPPVILTLSMQEEQAVKEGEEIFARLGYQIEPFGGREFAVTGVPAHLPTIDKEELLKEVIDTLTEENAKAAPEILLDKVASMSCKAAVKGNSTIPVEQMHELLKELMTLENPYHCPHGRPTMIKMTKYELEKKFKRII